MNSEQKLREALELAEAALSGANMNMNVVMRKIREALAAPDCEHVGLTNREMPILPPVEEGGFGNGPFRYTDQQMLAYGRASIAAHEAKRRGAA